MNPKALEDLKKNLVQLCSDAVDAKLRFAASWPASFDINMGDDELDCPDLTVTRAAIGGVPLIVWGNLLERYVPREQVGVPAATVALVNPSVGFRDYPECRSATRDGVFIPRALSFVGATVGPARK